MTTNRTRADWSAVASAAEARNEAYLRRVVEGLNVCPFARSARLEGRADRVVVPQRLEPDGSLAPGREVAETFAALASSDLLEVVQVIFPLVEAHPNTWVRAVKVLTARLNEPLAGPSAVACAALHPDLPYSAHSPAALVSLFRRAPDPTIQWVRLDALDRVRAGRPNGDVPLPSSDRDQIELLTVNSRASLDDVIASANMATARRLGFDVVEAMLDEVRTTPD